MRWGWLRQKGARLLTESFRGNDLVKFDTIMGLVIIMNAVTLVLETDLRAGCTKTDVSDCVGPVFPVLNISFLLIYTLESSLRLFVQRTAFWFNGWNLLDVGIIVAGWLDWVAPAADLPTEKLSMFRLCRLARVIRIVKVVHRWQMLTNMIRGFTGAMRAMLCGISLILILLVMWSILAVEVINPISQRIPRQDEYCYRAFTSVLRTTLYFFQTLVAGDSWGLCTIPIINAEPYTYALFALALVSVQLGFMNLVLAVIVDKAAEAREGDKAEQLLKKQKEEIDSLAKWKFTMESLDTDGSGTITEKELLEGYSIPTVKQTLGHLHICEEDLSKLFRVMDCDDSGQLGYGEFVNAFHQAQIQSPAVYMMIMRLTVEKIMYKVENDVSNGLRQVADAVANLHAIAKQRSPEQPEALLAQRPASAKTMEVGDEEELSAIPEEEKQMSPPNASLSLGCGMQLCSQRPCKDFQTEQNFLAECPIAAQPAKMEALAVQLSAMQGKIEARLDSLTVEAREGEPPGGGSSGGGSTFCSGGERRQTCGALQGTASASALGATAATAGASLSRGEATSRASMSGPPRGVQIRDGEERTSPTTTILEGCSRVTDVCSDDAVYRAKV